MLTCFAFNLFLLSVISCPALLKIRSDGTDVPGIERYFLQAWICVGISDSSFSTILRDLLFFLDC